MGPHACNAAVAASAAISIQTSIPDVSHFRFDHFAAHAWRTQECTVFLHVMHFIAYVSLLIACIYSNWLSTVHLHAECHLKGSLSVASFHTTVAHGKPALWEQRV